MFLFIRDEMVVSSWSDGGCIVEAERRQKTCKSVSDGERNLSAPRVFDKVSNAIHVTFENQKSLRAVRARALLLAIDDIQELQNLNLISICFST